MKLTAFEIIIVSLCVLVIGTPAGLAFAKLAHRYSLKKLWYATLLLWIFATAITPFVVYKERDLVSSIVVGGVVFAIALSWYFALGYQAFASLIPIGHSMEYTGIFNLFGAMSGWIEPAVYAVIYQVTNSQRIAMLSLTFWNILAVVALYFIDFEQGKLDAKKALGKTAVVKGMEDGIEVTNRENREA